MRALLLAGLATLALWAVACSGGGDAATSTPTSEAQGTAVATSTAAAIGSAAPSVTPNSTTLPTRTDPNVDRAWAHLEMLVGTIGSRPSTTEAERRAAEYIRDQLSAAGYQATLEEFPVQATLGGSATLTLPDGSAAVTAPLGGSANGSVSAPLVFAGIGRTSEFAAVDVRGKVAVVDRGELTFGEKVRNAQAAGAVGLIVVNNVPGMFRGDLSGEPDQIPAVSVASESRAALEAGQRSGNPATIVVTTNRISGTSQNVVGKPSDAPCTAYLGAHYDSVPAGPGANDNASGTALMLELARARRYPGVCVIAFGSEEVGLFGSKAYVRDHQVSSANTKFMLNFDMVAKSTTPVMIGDPKLTAVAKRVAAEHDLDVDTLTTIGMGTSSDHASFEAAGVPVLMFHSGNDEFIHTERDNLDNLSRDDLERFLETAVATLDQLLAA